MSDVTPRGAFPYSEGSDDANTIDDTMKLLAERCAAINLIFESGGIGARPTSSVMTPGVEGRVYYATDIQTAYFDYGTGWLSWRDLLPDGSITNVDINSAAAIAYSKLSLAASIVNADIANGAAIAYSKLSLANSIVNADVNAAAAIAYSKLNLSNSLVAGDITSGAVTGPKLGTVPAVHVYRTSDQTLAPPPTVIISWDAEYLDNSGMHDNAVNPSRITCQQAGTYLFSCHVNVGNARQQGLTVMKNGADYTTAFAAITSDVIVAQALVSLAVNDYVEIKWSSVVGPTTAKAGSSLLAHKISS